MNKHRKMDDKRKMGKNYTHVKFAFQILKKRIVVIISVKLKYHTSYVNVVYIIFYNKTLVITNVLRVVYHLRLFVLDKI